MKTVAHKATVFYRFENRISNSSSLIAANPDNAYSAIARRSADCRYRIADVHSLPRFCRLILDQLVDVHLLTDRQYVVDQPVQHQTGRKAQEHECEYDRQGQHDLLLHGIHL